VPKRKQKEPLAFDVRVLLLLEAIRLEVRASAEETPAFRAALRYESDAISARVLGNG